MKKRAILIIISSLFLLASCKKRIEIGKCTSKSAISALNQAVKAMSENKSKLALKLLFKSLDKCTLPKSYRLIGKIYLSEGSIGKCEKYFKKALYIYNKMYLKNRSDAVKGKISEVYFDLACCCVLRGSTLKALAYLNLSKETGSKDFKRFKTSPYMTILYGSKYKDIFEKDNGNSHIAYKNYKVFSYYEGYNPFKIKIEVNFSDYKAITLSGTSSDDRNKLFLKYQIDKKNPVLYKVFYDENNQPVKMDVLIAKTSSLWDFAAYESFYFDNLGRLSALKSYQPNLNGHGYSSYYYYKDQTSRIIKLVRIKLFLPFYVEEVFVQEFA